MSDDSSSEEAEFQGSDEENENESSAPQSSSDDDEPIASLKSKDKNDRSSPRRSTSRKNVTYNEDSEEEDDEDDDLPLAQLAKKKEPTKIPSTSTNGKSTTSKKKAETSEPPKKKVKSETSSVSSSKSSSKKFEFASTALYGTECLKGLLIQRLLCRWWYAVDWPKLDKDYKPPIGYEPLDGFPGVFVCTSSSNAGHLLDTRDMEQCPSFKNYARKPASELQTLLLKALEEQKRQLIDAEGSGTSTEKEIDGMIKWAKKINPDKAEKEAAKVLKANKITI